jgi:3',5'-cyclic AMP phosphodiesterase CpdA
MIKFVDFLINKIKGYPFYAVRGNHDFNNMLENGKQIGYPLPEVISFYLSFMPEVPYRSLDDNGLYYYFDNHDVRIRYIVIDSSYGCKIDMTRLGVNQLQWLVSDAISSTPSDYSIVLFSHIPIDLADDNMTFTPLKTILSAVNSRSSGSVVCEGIEVPYDFSVAEYNVFLVMSGHIHTDSQTYDERVLYVTTACDRVSNEMVSQYDEEPRQIRRPGDVLEQAFDVVTIKHSEENWIDLTRIGAGFSRFFNRDNITIRVGESVNLTKKLSKITPQKWRSNDSPGPIGNWRAKEWIYTSTVIELNGGVVLAKKTGSAIVYAEDDKRNKEFFLVDVID